MQEREAIILMESHDLSKLVVSRENQENGWIIHIHIKSPANKQDTLDTKREKTPRIFKTSDAALRWCKKIGFNEATVTL